MPKSSLRGGAKAHRKRSQHRTQVLKFAKEKAQREFMDMIRGMQQKQFEEQTAEQQANIVGVEELGNIGEGLELNVE